MLAAKRYRISHMRNDLQPIFDEWGGSEAVMGGKRKQKVIRENGLN